MAGCQLLITSAAGEAGEGLAGGLAREVVVVVADGIEPGGPKQAHHVGESATDTDSLYSSLRAGTRPAGQASAGRDQEACAELEERQACLNGHVMGRSGTGGQR